MSPPYRAAYYQNSSRNEQMNRNERANSRRDEQGSPPSTQPSLAIERIQSDHGVCSFPKSVSRRRYGRRTYSHRQRHPEPLVDDQPARYQNVPGYGNPEDYSRDSDASSIIHKFSSPDNRLQLEISVVDIRSKWLEKPVRATLKAAGTYGFDYAPSTRKHVMSSLCWPKAFAYHNVPGLFKLNPRAYTFIPGKVSHEIIINEAGEGGSIVDEDSLPCWEVFFREQKFATIFGVTSLELEDFWVHEQAWASWWSARWAITGRYD